MNDFNQFSDLSQTGYADRTPTDPKDEFFHSVYIAGVTRTNEAGITEEAGKLQARGVQYNNDSIHFIITHTKQVLAKIHRDPAGKETIQCFTFQEGPPPWFGSHQNHQCGTNSAERAADQWCQPCRAQMIVAGIMCEANGNPIKNEDGKPQFIFIRGKGMKYAPVADYLSEMSKLDLEPFFHPQSDESRAFEKSVVNNKRFVTTITIDEVPSNFGPKKVFKFTAGTQIPNEVVAKILEAAKKSLGKFKEKFDWGKNAAAPATGYAQQQPAGDGGGGLMQADAGVQQQPPQQQPQSQPPQSQQAAPDTASTGQKSFSFEDLEF